MALPENFLNATQYFKAALDFLQTHAWIYREANTRILSSGVYEAMPVAFKQYFLAIDNDELNRFPFVHTHALRQPSAACEVQEFRAQLAKLIPQNAFEPPISIESTQPPAPAKQWHKMNAKKQHEITKLAALIHSNTCQDTNLLIDFGAGLGYLSQQLYVLNPSNVCILGLEADAYRVQAACARRDSYLPKSAAKSISYQQHFISEQSRTYIEQQAAALSCATTSAIIGLHACADLSISSIKLFLSMPQVRRLLIMPCCYHKLEVRQAEAETIMTFVNFPLSAALSDAVVACRSVGATFLNRPFLRLACQQTTARWQYTCAAEHQAHGRQMYLRAIAEAVLLTADEYVTKLKAAKIANFDLSEHKVEDDADNLTFADLKATYELRSLATRQVLQWSAAHVARFNEINARYANGIGQRLAEALTCLQTAMQKLCENIVLYDRLCYMVECAAAEQQQLRVCYKKLLDEKLSPRCYVMIAEKLTR